MTKPYRLHYAPDNASLIIRLALDHLAIPYETVLIDRTKNAQSAPDYLALNPNGLIPTLETPNGPLFETGAILLWIGDRHPGLGPGPNDPARGDYLKWLFFVSNTLHAELRMLFYPEKYVGDDLAAQSALHATLRQSIVRHLTKLETLAAQPTPFFAAASPSALDFYVVTCLRWLALYPRAHAGWFDVAALPNLFALAQRIENRPQTARAIIAEGLGQTPFSHPSLAIPPEGSAT